MNILLFGGNSQRNKEWIHQVSDVLRPDFDKSVVHDYDHWDGRGEFINFDLELSQLGAEVVGLDPYVVFAKSVGSLLTLKAIALGILRPTRCIFAGLPIKLAEEDQIPLADLLKSTRVPTEFIQNTYDPLASYSKLVEYLESTGAVNYQTVELDGDTHSYDELEKIKLLVHSFVANARQVIA